MSVVRDVLNKEQSYVALGPCPVPWHLNKNSASAKVPSLSEGDIWWLKHSSYQSQYFHLWCHRLLAPGMVRGGVERGSALGSLSQIA